MSSVDGLPDSLIEKWIGHRPDVAPKHDNQRPPDEAYTHYAIGPARVRNRAPAERYQRGSVLITSNLPFSKSELIFKDTMTTAAAIDRLVHHSLILELNLPSYRVEQQELHVARHRDGRMAVRLRP